MFRLNKRDNIAKFISGVVDKGRYFYYFWKYKALNVHPDIIESLIKDGKNEILAVIDKSNSADNLNDNLRQYYSSNPEELKYHGSLSLLIGAITGIYLVRTSMSYSLAEVFNKNFINDNLRCDTFEKIFDVYEKSIFDFIQEHNEYKNVLLPSINGGFSKDFRQDFSWERFQQIKGNLLSRNHVRYNNEEDTLAKILYSMAAVYSSDELFNYSDIVKFEM